MSEALGILGVTVALISIAMALRELRVDLVAALKRAPRATHFNCPHCNRVVEAPIL